MDWGAVLGGAIVGLVAVVPVLFTNRAMRQTAREGVRQSRSDSLHIRLQGIKADLRSGDRRVALDSVDELKQMMTQVSRTDYRQQDREAVWVVMSSRLADAAQQYPEERPIEVQVRPELEVGP